MTYEYQLRMLPHQTASESTIKDYISREKGIDVRTITHVRVLKRSIDARQRTIYVNLKVRVYVNEEPCDDEYERTEYKDVSTSKPVIVVGAGPGGLFAALRLIELGLRPIIVERGKDVRERKKDIAFITKSHKVDPESNYCFGEGGAGAYSDGKLYTRSKKRGNIRKILNVFCQHGASTAILADAHPHIGTDKLPRVIENMRNTIINCGGEVHFQTKMTGFLYGRDCVEGITAVDMKSGRDIEFRGPVILATGHSARDVYEYLYGERIEIEAKSLAVGVRLEHPAELIDQIQYHSKTGRGRWLPAAEYSFVTQVDGRGVYSFCMCPGGVVVPAASGDNQLVVNGMSSSGRNSKWANSGMVVEVRPEDLKGYSPDDELRVMRFQQELESICFKQAGSSQRAGAQRMIDFVEGRASRDLPLSSYAPGIQPSRLDKWLPSFIGNRLRKGFKVFGHSANGLLTNDAIVIGVETRTSSPVRIPRDSVEMRHVVVEGLYPCGEGAGYAGGIVSAAIDGERCADALVSAYYEK